MEQVVCFNGQNLQTYSGLVTLRILCALQTMWCFFLPLDLQPPAQPSSVLRRGVKVSPEIDCEWEPHRGKRYWGNGHNHRRLKPVSCVVDSPFTIQPMF